MAESHKSSTAPGGPALDSAPSEEPGAHTHAPSLEPAGAEGKAAGDGAPRPESKWATSATHFVRVTAFKNTAVPLDGKLIFVATPPMATACRIAELRVTLMDWEGFLPSSMVNFAVTSGGLITGGTTCAKAMPNVEAAAAATSPAFFMNPHLKGQQVLVITYDDHAVSSGDLQTFTIKVATARYADDGMVVPSRLTLLFRFEWWVRPE